MILSYLKYDFSQLMNLHLADVIQIFYYFHFPSQKRAQVALEKFLKRAYLAFNGKVFLGPGGPARWLRKRLFEHLLLLEQKNPNQNLEKARIKLLFIYDHKLGCPPAQLQRMFKTSALELEAMQKRYNDRSLFLNLERDLAGALPHSEAHISRMMGLALSPLTAKKYSRSLMLSGLGPLLGSTLKKSLRLAPVALVIMLLTTCSLYFILLSYTMQVRLLKGDIQLFRSANNVYQFAQTQGQSYLALPGIFLKLSGATSGQIEFQKQQIVFSHFQGQAEISHKDRTKTDYLAALNKLIETQYTFDF